MTDEVLHTKYRPRAFEDVVGQDHVTGAMAKIIERGGSHAFLLSGPSGTGKTTLARIAARVAGCDMKQSIEMDGATNNGIDAMRQVQDALRYKAFGKKPKRAIIVDECHALSKAAWNSLLKCVEEPPEHVYWFFCTTEVSKVLPTIKTRCTAFTLKLVKDEVLLQLVSDVAKLEKIKLGDAIADLIVKSALGSPRQALVSLELCRGITDRKVAADVLRTATESDTIIMFCRFVLDGKGSWQKAMSILADLDGENPESVRIVMCNYLAAVLRNAKSNDQAGRTLEILSAFSTSYNASEGMAPLYLSLGNALFSN